jgi:hypothetical protein
MSLSRDEATKRAKADAGNRTGVSEDAIKLISAENAEFPDAALGAAVSGEMSGMMLTSGWRIIVDAGGKSLEYRANPDQIRLYKFKGKNYRI